MASTAILMSVKGIFLDFMQKAVLGNGSVFYSEEGD